MGLEIDRDRFEDTDYERFGRRLDACIEALRAVVARPGFGEGPPSIGVELEMHLVDEHGRPSTVSREVIGSCSDACVTTEIARFNLELNTAPLALAGRPFTALKSDLDEALREIRCAARLHRARVATIGILPTLRETDLDVSALTQSHRYRALAASLRRRRGSPFRLRIEGDDTVDLVTDEVSMEGANAAFQVHLKVPPQRFAACYNAAQIAAAPVLACSTNSPIFLGRRLWEETRVALFRQSVDERSEPWRPARVTFGHGWVRRGALELFEESVAMHEPLLPIVSPEDPCEVVSAGCSPRLAELRLHQGTTWRWNRAIYDDAEGGHLRIEMRAFPSGPTVVDMVASTAFAVGLTIGLASRIDDLLVRMTFGHARENFYEAARRGLDASFVWPQKAAPSPRVVAATEAIADLLPVAREGLVASDVEPAEADVWLDVIARRLARRVTGARWQLATYEALHADAVRMLDRYVALSEEGASVAEWGSA